MCSPDFALNPAPVIAYADDLPILRRRLALIALIAACRVPRPVVPSEDSRIARIEENLLPAVMIEGRGGGRPIAERLAEHEVSGLALAVIVEGRTIWTRGYGDVTPGTRFPGGDLGVGLPTEVTVADVAGALARRGTTLHRESGGHALYYDPRTGQGAVALTRSLSGAALAAEVLRAVAAEYGWSGFPGPVVKKVTALPPDRLAEYEGRYQVTPEVILTVSVAEGRLTIGTPDDRPAELYPAGDDRFFLLERDATVTFERDAAKKITALVAIVAGRTIRGARL